MIDEYEYAIIKRLIRKVTTNIDNFTTIDSDTLVLSINGYMSIHPIGIRDKTTGTKIYERDLALTHHTQQYYRHRMCKMG